MAAAAIPHSDKGDHGSKALRKINLVFLGERSTGKTALINRFMHDTKKDNLYKVDIDSANKTLTVQNHGLQLHLFDTSGQESCRATISGYIRHSTVFIVVYDVTDSVTFSHTAKWIDIVRSEHGNDSIIVLCGNKIELADKREISTEEGEGKAKELNVMFIETSAVAGPNVTILFQKVITALLNLDFQTGTHACTKRHDSESDCAGCKIV